MHAPTNITKTTTTTTTARRALLGAAALLLAVATLLVVSASADAKPHKKPHAKPRPKGNSHVSWAPELDRKIVPTRSEAHGAQIATWYGPGFFGHGTACGGTLKKETWGIAHRTLPCGTLVTLSHRGRKVTVRVIDRGPFSGATVDLTSRTKSYLHFVSGTVKMTEVKKFRLLPKPNKKVVGTFAARG